MPTEAEGVVTVSSVGPVNSAASPYPRKAYYSDYGVRQTIVAAPGGDCLEFFNTPQYNAPENRILAPVPTERGAGVRRGRCKQYLDRRDDVRSDGRHGPLPAADAQLRQLDLRAVPVDPGHLDGRLPHAAGVAAIVVAARGKRDASRGGLTLDPDKVERILRKTASDTPCPAQEPFTYPDNPPGVPPALCEGTPAFNGFYGDGIVNALAASQAR